MISLPLSVILLPKLTGFIASCTVLILQGAANAVLLSSLFGLASYLPFAYIIALSTGQGISGIMMNIIRYGILISFGKDAQKEENMILGSLIFFGISALFLLVCLLLTFILFNNQYFKDKINNSGEFDDRPSQALSQSHLLLNNKDALNVYNIYIYY